MEVGALLLSYTSHVLSAVQKALLGIDEPDESSPPTTTLAASRIVRLAGSWYAFPPQTAIAMAVGKSTAEFADPHPDPLYKQIACIPLPSPAPPG